MGLFSLLRKNKQENATSGDSGFRSRSEEESKVVRGRGKRKQRDQAAEPVDPVLPQKKRARRRLVGALALVLAVVIGLPMVLDSEPKPLANDIAIQIPSKDKPAAPVSQIGNQQPAVGASAKVAASASLEQKEEMVEMSDAAGAAAKESRTAPEALPSSVLEQAPANAQAVGRSEAKPTPEAAGKAQAKAADHAADKADEAARAKAILEGKADGKANAAKVATDQKSGKFVVQVAALASKEKINELQIKLNDAGIRSYTQKVATESGDRTRIRVGPFTNKEEAEKMRAKLSKLGLNGTMVPPSQ
jgi:DedD protein